MSCDYYQLPHEGIKNLEPYVPGKSIEELAQEKGLEDIIKLASNENPLGCSPKVLEALAALSKTTIATYPAPLLHPLRKKLAEKLNIIPEMVTLGNGSDLLFTTLLTVFGLHNDKYMLTHKYAFISFSIQAQTLGISTKISAISKNWQVDIEAMISACKSNISMIFIANPNNPTGFFIPEEKIEKLLKNISDSIIVIIDEAYYEFAYAKNHSGALHLLQKFPNLVVTRTFSKAYGLAGLRLGYALANPEISALLQKAQLPFIVNQAALASGVAALEDTDFLKNTLENNKNGLEYLQKELKIIQLNALSSHCNFITFDCKRNSIPIYQQLLQKGIIVRPLIPYGLPNHLRVSVGTQAQNERFIKALREII